MSLTLRRRIEGGRLFTKAIILLSIVAEVALAGGAPMVPAELQAVQQASDDAAMGMIVKFKLQNIGNERLLGCVGPSWGWEFVGETDIGQIVAGLERRKLDLAPGKSVEWTKRIRAHLAPEESSRVRFQFDLYRESCEGESIGRVTSNTIQTGDARMLGSSSD